VPGSLLVRATLDAVPKPDVLRDMPTTWLYERNIGRAPICFATGPLEGDRALAGERAEERGGLRPGGVLRLGQTQRPDAGAGHHERYVDLAGAGR